MLGVRHGLAYLAESDADGEGGRTLRPLQATAITYRIAFGPRAGQKVLTWEARCRAECSFSTAPASAHP
ncbi:MAG: hypothetical protein IPO59_17875 [Betaproteobacteria bacterium]|nr:hypothetical protein [Betaproteobacteria bacterium]